jgi:hypothetical protein
MKADRELWRWMIRLWAPPPGPSGGVSATLDEARRGDSLNCPHHRFAVAGCDENGYLPADEVGRESRQSIVLSIRPPVLDRDVSSFHIALFIQSPAKRWQHVGIGFGIAGAEPADHRHRALLPARRERQSARCTQRSEEFAPSKANAHLPLPCEETRSRQDSTACACSP